MYTSYSSYTSTVALRTTTYYGFNDYSSCYCTCCCKFSVSSTKLILPINKNPNLLYGLRQSSLIQSPPCKRRVVLGSCDRYYCPPLSIYDVGSRCCRESCCCEISGGVGGRVLGSKGFDGIRVGVVRGGRDFRSNVLGERKNGGVDKIRCNALGERKSGGVDKIRSRVIRDERKIRCNALDDAEAMLSLLSEVGVDESVLVKGRRKSSSKDARVVREQNVATEKWKDVKSNSSESKSKKQELRSSRDRIREEGHKRREERESDLIDDNVDMGLRRRDSGSSYYSVVESGEFESDNEVDFEEEMFAEKSSTTRGKDSRKTGGVVISEVADDVVESSKDQKYQQLVSSRRENEKVGSSTEWDWRKKSEKKLTDESAEVIKSRKESILRQTQLSQVNEKNSSIVASSSKKQFNNVEEESTSEFSSHRQSRSRTRRDDSVSDYTKSSVLNEHTFTGNQANEQFVSGSQHGQSNSGASSSEKFSSQMKIDNETSVYLKSSQQHDQSLQTNRQNIESTSTATRTPIQRPGATVVSQSAQETGCDYCKTCGRIVQESEIDSDAEQRAEISGIQRDAQQTATVQGHSERRHRIQETGTSSSQALVQVERKKRDKLNSAAGQVDATLVSAQYNESQDFDFSRDQSTVRVQEQQEMRKKKLEETSTWVISPSDAEMFQVGLGDRVTKEADSRKLLQIGASGSQVHSTSGETSRHSAYDRRVYNEQTYSTSEVEERNVLQVGFTGNFSGEDNTSQQSLDSIPPTGAQQVNEVEDKSDWQLAVISPSLQLIEWKSSESEPESGIFGRSTGSEVEGGSGYSQPQGTRLLSFNEGNQSDFRFVEESSHEDAISSVERMHESSALIVHDFVERTRLDSSASETRLEKESSTDSLPGDLSLVKQDSGHASGSSGTKEQSEIMWDAKDHSVGEASELELTEAEISENGVARRTGKLWNVVGDLFRLRWGSVSETLKSPGKSSQQRFSNVSASGETWFSGNEHEGGTSDSVRSAQVTLSQEPSPSNPATRHSDRKIKKSKSMPQESTSGLSLLMEKASKSRKKDRRKKDQRIMSEEPALDQSPHRRTTNKSQKGDAGLMSLDDQLGPVEFGVSPSASTSQGGFASGNVSIGANTGLNITQQISQPSPPPPLVPSFGRLRRSDALKEDAAFQKIEEHISSTSELKGQRGDVMESGAPTPEEIDTELKRRKLQRSKQVISDRFDEWEDAYRRENELRKVDEIFMREALAEAMKAADSWEVPVGAVLVQNGKIIARGFNLVEELRDSTAHAEMICIREASNVLRTWRLSETTLYVTLEPCPMCAGAILQARIGTLVWGAPNKLLGADGSWIRLFPEGVEVEERSEVADKPTPPKHPFHPNMKIRRGVLESECAQIMQQFFQLRRKKEKRKEKETRKEKVKEKGNDSDGEGQPSCLPVPHTPTRLLRKMHGVFHTMKSL